MGESFEFLEVIESVEAENAEVANTLARLANGDPTKDGKRVRSNRNQRFLAGMAYAGQLYKDVVEGKRRWSVLREAMGTSDFPLYMAGVLDRGMLGRYQETPQTWSQYAARREVRDFRTIEEYAMDGLEGVLLEVHQQEEYPEAALTEARYTWTIKKYGRRVPYSWESYINDDLDAFSSIPDRLSRATRRSEDKFATALHVGTTGPLGTVYTGGNKNQIITANGAATNNPPLSVVGLQDGFKVYAAMKDADGEPISIEMAILEVPPTLEITARNILNAMQIVVTEAGGTSGQQLWAENWMRSRVSLVVNPYIPIVASSSNGATTWFLHAAPSSGRPAFRMGFLRGYAEPGLYIKSPNARRAGGGDVDPFEGDFDTDTIEQKVRHCFGGTVLDPKGTIASNGSGV